MCMCACMYVFLLCMFVCMYVGIQICMYVCMYVCICTCICFPYIYIAFTLVMENSVCDWLWENSPRMHKDKN